MRRLAIVFALLGIGVGTSWGQTIFNGYAIVNNTFYDLSASTGNTDFQSADLGDFGMGEVIKLGGQTGFWSNGSGVDFIRLFYRVYPTTGPATGAYTSIPYAFQSFSSPNDQWGTDVNGANTDDISQNINTNSYIPGNYTLEIYVEGKANNGVSAFDSQSGSNYTATFDILAQIKSGDSFTSVGDISVTGNFEVQSTGTMTVNSGHTLTVSGNITNNGTINIDNSGSLVQTAAADGNSSLGTYNVTRNTGTLVDDTRYQLWSSPVASANMGTVFTGANTSDFYAFDVSTQNWASHSGTMTPGKGYMSTGTINISGTGEDRTFSGAANNGDVTYTFASSISSTQYAAVGNPYPSAIDIATFIGDQTNISNTVYFWDHATGTNTDYATYTSGSGGTAGSGGVTPDAYVQVAQGFIVEATGGSASSIVFENDQRVSGNNTQFFKGRTETRERMWLNALSSAGNNQILVAFVPEATDGLDVLYDGKKLKGNPNFAFYSVLEDEDYAIQGLNTLLPEETKVIPLGIDLASPGEVRFELDSLDNWPNAYSAYLIDKEANAEHDLLSGGAYVVQLADSWSIRDRFELVVNRAPEAPSSVEEVNGDRVRLWMSNQELFVQFAEDRGGVAQVDVFDLAGRAVHTSNQDQNRYALTGLDHGTYVVRVTFGNASVKTQTLVNMP